MRKYYYTKAKNGLDLTCDICGRVIFLKRIKGHEFANGRLTAEIYESVKGGWTFEGKRDICPECGKKK